MQVSSKVREIRVDEGALPWALGWSIDEDRQWMLKCIREAEILSVHSSTFDLSLLSNLARVARVEISNRKNLVGLENLRVVNEITLNNVDSIEGLVSLKSANRLIIRDSTADVIDLSNMRTLNYVEIKRGQLSEIKLSWRITNELFLQELPNLQTITGNSTRVSKLRLGNTGIRNILINPTNMVDDRLSLWNNSNLETIDVAFPQDKFEISSIDSKSLKRISVKGAEELKIGINNGSSFDIPPLKIDAEAESLFFRSYSTDIESLSSSAEIGSFGHFEGSFGTLSLPKLVQTRDLGIDAKEINLPLLRIVTGQLSLLQANVVDLPELLYVDESILFGKNSKTRLISLPKLAFARRIRAEGLPELETLNINDKVNIESNVSIFGNPKLCQTEEQREKFLSIENVESCKNTAD
ncbi:MAG: hypothetical protein HRU19_29160 [Pseudobacteriovorax sp.]|nr:hypothetical protein [Pseudobacteriovorax sp.]